MSREFLFSAAPEFSSPALEELRRLVPGLRLQKWLGPGTGLAAVDLAYEELAPRVRGTLFVRHLAPVDLVSSTPRSLDDLQALARGLVPAQPVAASFSVQMRTSSDVELFAGRKEVAEALAGPFLGAGFRLDVRNPDKILSAYFLGDSILGGFSDAASNLSSWPGGERRFAWEDGQISRAEFKLLEAIEVFALSFPRSGRALDLGASPGGWTRVLRALGLKVVAVDPGALHESLVRDSLVEHFRGTVQRFVAERGKRPAQFDVIVNDMRMDARESVHMTRVAAGLLRSGGTIVMTLKLPGRKAADGARRALAEIERDFHVVAARQLFHNRNEVTVVLRPLGGSEKP